MENVNSDSDSDIDLENYVSNNLNMKKVYQLQYTIDNKFKFVFMGLFETLPSVPLGDFKADDDAYCYITSNFVFEEELKTHKMIPQITLIINKNNHFFKLSMGIEFENDINIEGENIGSTFIMFTDEQKGVAEIVKKKLIYPGSAKIIYFLVNELKNDKIKTYINEHSK
jgi:hypothetical protein